jgi:hypothetical protein
MTIEYIPRGVPRSVPTGRVLVHNQVRHNPGTPVGTRGFRAWTQLVDDGSPLLPCDCGWAPLADAHYRVDLERR